MWQKIENHKQKYYKRLWDGEEQFIVPLNRCQGSNTCKTQYQAYSEFKPKKLFGDFLDAEDYLSD